MDEEFGDNSIETADTNIIGIYFHLPVKNIIIDVNFSWCLHAQQMAIRRHSVDSAVSFYSSNGSENARKKNGKNTNGVWNPVRMKKNV